MNRFRTKKKVKESPDGIVRASTDSDAPPVTKPSKGFRLGGRKAPEPEPAPELDLSTALPSSDDFRTSLLMSGLSARFSMLREQDDPNSKIGKASDDSVLFSKRQSRLNDFDFSTQGLSDIAEVSSIHGSIRPRVAAGRTDSFAGSEDYGLDDDATPGSIMNRAKPGEGNNLFGGRQKIMLGNRALYDNDVSQSAFQKIRERERIEKEQERQREEDAQTSRPSSPPLSGYNRNRETSSTTSSGGPSTTRDSTAGTSVTSQRTPSLNGGHTPVSPNIPGGNGSLERTGTKTRRLYETGLDNHLHESQFSAMSRIDTLTRQRTLGTKSPPPGAMSPSYGPTSGDLWQRSIAGKQSMPNLRTASPPPTGSAMSSFDFGVRKISNASSKPFGLASPPLSPPVSEYDEQGIFPLQPNDRGKATALGAFSKPAPYDENKYTQRQLQMQQGRETPPPMKDSPFRPFFARNQQQQMVNRTRAESDATHASDRSRSNSSGQRAFISPDRIPEATVNENNILDKQATSTGAFLASPNGAPSVSPYETAPDQSRFRNQPKPLDLSHLYRPDQRIQIDRPDESQHPAHRPQTDSSPSATSPDASNMNLPATSQQPPADSPTLGPGLGGIRQHLRSDSNTSSVSGGSPSAHFPRFPTETQKSIPQNEYSSKSSPWDNDWDQESSFGEDRSSVTSGGTAHPLPLTVRSPNIDASVKEPRSASWEREMEARHIRVGSTETQKEHQAFQEELASRRRKVQEKMKSMVESDSRSTSPLPPLPADWPKDAHQVKSNALGLLRNKTSMGSLVGRPKEAPPVKGMKLLGIGNATITSGTLSPGTAKFEDVPWNQAEEENEPGRSQDAGGAPPPTKAFREARRAAQRDREREVALRHQQRLVSDSDQEWPVQRKERERPRLGNQRMDNSWVDNARDNSYDHSRVDNYRMDQRMDHRVDGRMDNRMDTHNRVNHRVDPRMDHRRDNRMDNRKDHRMDHRMDNRMDHRMDHRMDNRIDNRMDHQLDNRVDNRIDHRMDNRMENRTEDPRRDNFYRDQGERVQPHMRPRQRTPSKERKPPPVTYHPRTGNSSQESNINGTNPSGSRPPSNSSRDRSESETSGGRSRSRTGAYREDLATTMVEGTSSKSHGYDERLTRLLPKSPGPPPGIGLPASPSPIPSPMFAPNRTRSNGKAPSREHFEKLPALQTGSENVGIGSTTRPSPTAPFMVNSTPGLVQQSQPGSGTSTPLGQGAPQPLYPAVRKRSINKSEISEPKFVSSTSRMTTVNLPPGSSLSNGNSNDLINDQRPPIPPVNPKRRQTRTMFNDFMGRRDTDEVHYMPAATQSTEEMSTFSADEGDSSKPKPRARLRKSSSEGGNLSARARQAAMNAESSHAMPGTFPAGAGSPPKVAEGGMF
ncbi:uncharacterized protein RAG0_09616 [Rhynchosporium agropyri]|uniref:Uncharacterized protein n=1 Tax=Rhynchosporium agropyri TaxID=914238 RepID=A0A1E1KWA3_9HELO|nr:uncharacterized protein RAG0_09616 [Rhynchosporium agropyri]